jgi:hypothetical protein
MHDDLGDARSSFPAALDYFLFVDFDCARGGRPTFFAGIRQVAQVRIVCNGHWRRWRHWPFATGAGHGRITQRNLHGSPNP